MAKRPNSTGMTRLRARLGRQGWARAAQLVGQSPRIVREWGGVENVQRALTKGVQWPWGGPMNGQVGRQALVRAIGREVDFAYAIETGTWLGGSTCFIADVLGCPVWTVEIDPQAYGFASQALGGRKDVTLSSGDSRTFLSDVAAQRDTTPPVFFYLDAHWDAADLPLWEEVRFIFETWDDPTVLIDDFAVPGDAGYGFDDYGPGRSLDLATLSEHAPEGVEISFPSLPSEQESGGKRGCCVLNRKQASSGWSTELLRGADSGVAGSPS